MMPAERSRLILAAAALLLAPPALAADYPVLRGTHTPSLPPAPMIEYNDVTDWNGFYIGAFGAYGAADVRPGRSTAPLINAAIERNIIAPGNRRDANELITRRNQQRSRMGYGVFVGYNVAADDALYGIEADYTRSDLMTHMMTLGPVSSLSRFAGDTQFLTVYGANTSTSLDGFGTIRGRAGLIYGNLMPYVTAGIAIGHGSVTQNADFEHTGMPRQQLYERRQKVWTGFTIGAGLEAQFGGLLLRGEYLFTRMEAPNAGAPITVNTARVGAGVKF